MANGGEPYGFTGEWWEAEVGLLYLRARWYRPETGTFLSVDPWMGNPLDPDSLPPSYQYVNGNPINFTDPTGLYLWFNITRNRNLQQHWQIENWFESQSWAGFWKTHLEFNQVTSPRGGQLRQDIIYFPNLASGTSSPIDFFGVLNTPIGEIYEIEPLKLVNIAEGLLQLSSYERILLAAASNRQLSDVIPANDRLGRSTGIYRGKKWDFNNVNWVWGTTLSPGPHVVPWPGQGDIWIVRPLPGLILYVDDGIRRSAAGTLSLAGLLPLARKLVRMAQTHPPIPSSSPVPTCSSFNFIYLPAGLLEGDFIKGVLDGNLKCVFGLEPCEAEPTTS